MAAAVRAAGSAPAEAPPPSQPAGPTRLVNPMLFGAAGWVWGADLHTHDDLIVENRPLLVSQRPGFYKQAFLTRNEGFGDFDLHARFTVRLTGSPSPRWPSTLLVNVSGYDGGYDGDGDGDASGPDARAYFDGEVSVLGASFLAYANGGRERFLLHGWSSYADLAPSFFDGTTEHHLHLSRRGGRGTIALDGRTVLNLPIDSAPRRLVFHLHVVGLEAAFSTFEITEPRAAGSAATGG